MRRIEVKILTVLLVVAMAGLVGIAKKKDRSTHKNTGTFKSFVWHKEVPAGCPFPPSKTVTGLEFLGIWSAYTQADTWYPSWGADGRLYSTWTDGKVNGVGSYSGAGTVGHAIIEGDMPSSLKVTESALVHIPLAHGYHGRYPCASLFYKGVWYLGTYGLSWASYRGYNWPIVGGFAGFNISRDGGKTWSQSPHSTAVGHCLFPEPEKLHGPVKFASPHVVDFGKAMQYSPDGKMYLVAHGATQWDNVDRKANDSWITGDQIYLCRVTPTPENVNDLSKYEFYAGQDAQGRPKWSRHFSDVKPLLTWNNHLGCVTITYDAPLKKYLMCITDGRKTKSAFNTMILEADQITGQWKLVTYMKDFGKEAYFVTIPSKFISADGRTLWLCYSANFAHRRSADFVNPPGSRYAMCLQKVRLLGK